MKHFKKVVNLEKSIEEDGFTTANEEIRFAMIEICLVREKGNISRAARFAKLHRNTFVRIMKQGGICAGDYKVHRN